MFPTQCKEHDHSLFYKFLKMEQNHKNQDCYFFYYSTCTKGDSCGFRHESSALGCEVMCQYWQQGNCLNERCNFRHMELKKNRKSIPCYWESQRGGCKKPHCPFMHSAERSAASEGMMNQPKTNDLQIKPVSQEWSNRPDDGKFDGSGGESDQGRGSSEAGSFIGSPAVDPLIVNFDEESDSEGVTTSPIKFPSTTRVPYCKTYEENRLEEIQAESAAYYSYDPSSSSSTTSISTTPATTTTTTTATYLQQSGGGKEKRITNIRALRKTTTLYPRDDSSNPQNSSDLNFKILTLDEIRKRKKEAPTKDKKIQLDSKNKPDNPGEIFKNAIKTLEEIKTSLSSSSSSDNNPNEKITTKLSRKRSFESCKISLDDCKSNLDCTEVAEKKIKIDKTTTTVPPVRLCRSVKKRIEINEEASKVLSQDSRLDPGEESARNQVIEVRLCDSSTDDVSSRKKNLKTHENIKNDDEKIMNNDDDDTSIDDLKFDQFIDGHSNDQNDSPGHESDDVLKDIDALLN